MFIQFAEPFRLIGFKFGPINTYKVKLGLPNPHISIIGLNKRLLRTIDDISLGRVSYFVDL